MDRGRLLQPVRDTANHVLRYRHLASISKPRLEHVGGCWFLVPPGVFNPKLWGTDLFARYLREHPALARGTALDLCTGSGIMAVNLAKLGAETTALDLNPEACRATEVNARLNDVVVEVIEGDLWEPVAGRRFDLIVTNPPWFDDRDLHIADFDLSAEPSYYERAFYAGPEAHLLVDLVRGIPQHLEEDGRALVGLSASLNLGPMLAAAGEVGLVWEVVASPAFWPSIVHFPIYEFRHRP